MSITTFFIGLLLIAAGVAMLKWNYQLTNNFGSMDFLTGVLGPGREYAVFKLLAIVVIIGGFVTMFGVHDDLMNFLLSPLKSIFQTDDI